MKRKGFPLHLRRPFGTSMTRRSRAKMMKPVPASVATKEGDHKFLLMGMTPPFCEKPQRAPPIRQSTTPHDSHRVRMAV